MWRRARGQWEVFVEDWEGGGGLEYWEGVGVDEPDVEGEEVEGYPTESMWTSVLRMRSRSSSCTSSYNKYN